MKLSRIGTVLLLFTVVGVLLFWKMQMRQEHRLAANELTNRGSRLTSLLALYPESRFHTDEKDDLLRTLVEQVPDGSLAYLFVHDGRESPFVSLVMATPPPIVPTSVRAHSLNATGVSIQKFKTGARGTTVYEFAKPVFDGAKQTHTIRLGLKMAPAHTLTAQKGSLLAVVAFLMLSSSIVGYYMITLAAKGLNNVGRDPLAGGGQVTTTPDTAALFPFMEQLDQSITELKTQMRQLTTDNAELASHLGVATFEKNQARQVLDATDTGLVVMDLQDRVSHMNRTMLSLLNTDLASVLNQRLDALIDNESVALFVGELGETRPPDSSETLEAEFPEFAPERTFLVTANFLENATGGNTGKLVSIRDITQTKLGKQAQEKFIGSLAHELFTPLTTMKTYTEMLMDGEVDDAETRRSFYNTINTETDRLTFLIQNLLNESRIQAGNLTLNKGLVRTDWLLRDCLPSIEASAVNKSITIEKHLPDLFPSLSGDKELLKVAIINILGNAVKYTPEGGTVTLTMVEKNGHLVLTIADTGVGISGEDLPHIFDRFYRAKGSEVQAQSGTGLGLAIASEIVKQHNGRIEVESVVGEGTRFTILIPVEEYVLDSA